jgi:hypothetical protein
MRRTQSENRWFLPPIAFTCRVSLWLAKFVALPAVLVLLEAIQKLSILPV